jgi:hypothetical protein
VRAHPHDRVDRSGGTGVAAQVYLEMKVRSAGMPGRSDASDDLAYSDPLPHADQRPGGDVQGWRAAGVDRLGVPALAAISVVLPAAGGLFTWLRPSE